jgi:hypothetical protein
MEELVALVFAFCAPNTSSLNQEVRCQTYVTNCAVDRHSHWDKKEVERCEQEGLRTNWTTYSEIE